MVQRSVSSEERECSNDPPSVPEPDHPRAPNTSFRVALQIHNVPADDNGAGGERTHGDETDPRILGRESMVHIHEDGEANDCEGNAEGDEGAAEAAAVGKVSDHEAEN